ncbi:MAG: DUF1820 family protein [Acidobacteria bacterium]|nr:DUF1820 family protein [Acidobacteriota bacterium]NIM62957.1 DUF1820 family protein [Acidobacteriota bacterium]NIO59111.1 DUF1820 family protein [Acidobacteriota bacterium]NIQ30142.1 DUF1820 family protein [Acidobacteriota bacterium]NIQ84980.1 DUF1820 family protein [Acidobacteriota bacterium]
MSTRKKEQRQIYKIIFMNQGKVCEIYAAGVSHGGMFGFVEVEEILFGEKTQVVVDPSEESLKLEFDGVKRTFIPMHSVIRIDEVEKEGTARITGEIKESTGNVASFPVPVFTPKGDSKN